MSRSMRKRCGVYNIAKASLIAKPDSQAALGMEQKKLRTYNYTSNEGQENIVLVYTMDSSNELVRLILEPNEKMLEAFKKSAPKSAYRIEKSV